MSDKTDLPPMTDDVVYEIAPDFSEFVLKFGHRATETIVAVARVPANRAMDLAGLCAEIATRLIMKDKVPSPTVEYHVGADFKAIPTPSGAPNDGCILTIATPGGKILHIAMPPQVHEQAKLALNNLANPVGPPPTRQ
jgi:hypothetical protein